MKKRFLGVTLLFGGIIAGNVCARAESVAIHVPFSFTAGAKTMPAGEYTLDSALPGVLLVRGAAGSSVVMVALSRDSAANKPRASFDHQDGRSVLASVTLSTGETLVPVTHETASRPAAIGVVLSHK